MSKEKIQKIKFCTLAIVCLIILSFSLSPKTLQNDTFYTIKIGEYIYENGISNLTTDPFSWHDSLPYTFPHWLYDFGIYLIYNAGGDFGVYLSTIILASILSIAIFFVNGKLSKNYVVSFVITVGAMYMLKDYIAARAQLLTFILFILTLGCIEAFLETKKKRYAVILIIIPIIIANVHLAVWPFYFVIYLPYIAEYLLLVLLDLGLINKTFEKIENQKLSSLKKNLEKINEILETNKNLENSEKTEANTNINQRKKEKIIEKIKISEQKLEKIQVRKEISKKKKEYMKNNPYKIVTEKNHACIFLIIIWIVCIATGLLTPVGDAPYTYLYKTMQGTTTQSINEHLPLTLANNMEFMLVIVLFLMLLIFTDSKIKLRDLFMLCGLLYLAFKSRRQVSMFVLLCSGILCKLIAYMFEKYDKNACEKIMKFTCNIFGTVIVVCLILILSLKMYKPKIDDKYVSETSYPVAASEWILENLDVKSMRLYNEYNYGSYLLFKGIPVFIDSRADLYTPEFNTKTGKKEDGINIFSDALNIASLATYYEDKFEKYGITHVMTYSGAKLSMIISKDSNYKLIYKDSSFKIYERLSAKTVNE